MPGVCVKISGAPTAPLLLFGASVSHTVSLPNSQLYSDLHVLVQERVMWNSEVCFPLARGVPLPLSWAHLCGVWQLTQPLFLHSGEPSPIVTLAKGEHRAGWQLEFPPLVNSFILSVLFVHLYVLIFFKKSLLIFIILYHKNVFLQYLSCQFIAKNAGIFISIGNTILQLCFTFEQNFYLYRVLTNVK